MEEHTNQNINDTRIHLAIAVDDLSSDYNKHACVTIASFLDHCPGEQVVVHILYCDSSTDPSPNQEKYSYLSKKYAAELIYYQVQLPEWVNGIGCIKTFTPGALLRFCIPDLLQNVDKVLYLDCDIVVNTNIMGFWEVDLTDFPLAAIPDSYIANTPISSLPPNYLQRLRITQDRYFNSGVLLINLDYLRQYGSMLNIALDFLHENPDFPYADQEVWNYFFGDKYLPMDSKYNFMIGSYKGNNGDLESILHYAGSHLKPWKAYHGEVDVPYWHYLLQTAWGENQNEILASMLKLPNITYLRDTDFATFYEQSGLPYVTLMKKIIPSLFTLTKKRVGGFIRNHF